MKIKVSDFIGQFLKNRGISHVFGVTGGASIHLLHSANKYGVNVVCNHHEQACAMAAEAYARIHGMGCAIATSGPGATNLLTGICGAYVDSVPCLFLTGQVVRNRMKGDTGVRSFGFQETDILSMVRPITKYSAQILNAKNIRYELERAWFIAKNGRPGPVLIDIPDDVQREIVDTEDLKSYIFDITNCDLKQPDITTDTNITKCIELINASKRPVLVCGWGVRLAKAEKELLELAALLNIPICPSWGAMDMIPSNHPLKVGGIGINGSRAGNFTVQNADLLLVIGARLSTRETGNPLKSFARAAKIIMVDIDASEITKFWKFGKNIDLAIVSDAKVFIKQMIRQIDEIKLKPAWWNTIKDWKRKYDPSLGVFQGHELTDPYVFMDKLSKNLNPGAIIVSDTGCAIPWLMQGFKFKKGQRLFHDFNNTAMGWAIPAAIGAHFATGKQIVCVVGDGSFLMNMQELATIMHHALPIKIFLLNNGGYSMVRQTEMEWLDDKNMGTGNEALSFPKFQLIANSHKMYYEMINKNHEINWTINRILKINGPAICDVRIPSTCKVWPKIVFGKPLEDMDPPLPRDELKENMIIDLWEK